MEVSNYDMESEEYGDLPNIDTVNYLESLDINLPYSTKHSEGDFEDIDTYLPSTSKVSLISDNQTTENFMKEFETFYAEMMGKVKTLKDTPALNKSNYFDVDNMDEEALFKNLKHTPEVQEQLDYIQKLDDDIKSVITEYKSEKAERLQTQLEMCNEITKNNTVPERDTELFLNLCQFEFSDTGNDDNKEKKEAGGDTKKTTTGNRKPNDFIMRNIYLAKEGMFANSSLTDEEKVKLEDLLQNEEKEDTEEQPQRNPFTLSNSSCGNKPKYFTNAYSFTVDDEKNIADIDAELEKFKLDEKISEKEKQTVEELRKMNDVLLEKQLIKLEAKLKEIYNAEQEDLEKFKNINDKKDINKETDEDIDDDELNNIGDLLDLSNLDFSFENLRLHDDMGVLGNNCASTEDQEDTDQNIKKNDEATEKEEEEVDEEEEDEEEKDNELLFSHNFSVSEK